MNSSANAAYRFNGFRIDPVRRLLFGADGEPIPLKPKVFDTLLYLVERRGVLVGKQALLEAVWPHVVVEENNLNKAISTLRQVFGETRDEHRFIVTEPGRGYRFVASVDAVPTATTERYTPPETLARVLESQSDYATLASATPARARGAVAGAEPTSSVTHPPPVITLRRTTAALALIALVSFAAIGVWSLTDRRTPPVVTAAVVRLSIPSTGTRFLAGFGAEHVALSADGSHFAHSLGDRILIRRLREQEPISIDVTNAASPSFSPDGEWLAFLSDGLKKVPSVGGAVVDVAALTDRPAGATWGTNGTIVFATTAGLYEVDEDGGVPRLLAKADLARGELQYSWPHFLPDGRSVLFTIVREGSINRAQIAWLDLRTLATEVLLTGGASARYVPTGHLVYGAAQTLMAVPFDLDARTMRGEPVALRDIAIATATDNGAADFAISDNGTLAYVEPRPVSPLTARTLVWVDRHGNEEPLPLEPGRYLYARVSPDGTRIAIDVAGSNRDIWIWDLGRETLTRLTDGPTEDMTPLWSPDGRRVFFASNRTGNFDVYSQPADGSTQARVEFEHPAFQGPSSFAPDGTQLVVNEEFRDLSVLDLTQRTMRPLLQRDANDWIGAVSPDGRWIAYESDESGVQFEIYLRPFPDVTGQREQVSIDGGRYPRWGPSRSNELYYVALDGAMMAVPIELTPTLRVGRAVKLFDFELPQRGISGRTYDVSEVDGRFLLVKFLNQTATETIDASVVLNWFEELREQAR
jgi:Tol biopolymer transport system component/DNA-binding winged helix-turn-helix (wHTH) protein